MKIQGIDMYFDGGTAKITTDEGTYYCDRSMVTNTNRLFDGFPSEKGSKLLKDESLKRKIVASLTELSVTPELQTDMGLYSNECTIKLISDIETGFRLESSLTPQESTITAKVKGLFK
jgi:hypothetical protein